MCDKTPFEAAGYTKDDMFILHREDKKMDMVAQMKLKPFNLDEALNGHEVFTRDGIQVTGLAYFDSLSSLYAQRVLAVVNGELQYFYSDGFWNLGRCTTSMDLFLAPKIITKWVNLYWNNDNVNGDVYSTKEDADTYQGKGRIACVPIEVDSGE